MTDISRPTVPGRFKKGQSGNPGGRPKDIYRLGELARERTEEALKTLLDVMRDKTAPHAARVSAACAVLDRGHGKPMQTTEITGKDGTSIEISHVDNVELARRFVYVLNAGVNEHKEMPH